MKNAFLKVLLTWLFGLGLLLGIYLTDKWLSDAYSYFSGSKNGYWLVTAISLTVVPFVIMRITTFYHKLYDNRISKIVKPPDG